VATIWPTAYRGPTSRIERTLPLAARSRYPQDDRFEVQGVTVTTQDAGPRALLSRAYRRSRFEVKTLLGPYPRLYLPIAHRGARGQPVGPDTDVVIEGFPRSGNTFATAAFDVALDSMTSDRPLIAHHIHAPSQVIAAARRGIPVLVVIRHPEDAVVSLLIQQPHVTARQALRAYRRFYRPLLPYRDRFVLARFEEVVRDFGAVIRRINERFGVTFPIFDGSEASVRLALQRIEAENRDRWRPGRDAELKGAFPSAVRDRVKEHQRSLYRRPALATSRAGAETVYLRLTQQPHASAERSPRSTERRRRTPA
jgi:hypothetical protein